jgi:beta-ureidopropionase
VVRAALTETRNAYRDMPSRVEDLELLAPRLDYVRRANVEHHVDLMEKAASDGVRAICFGELFPGPYFALSELAMWRGLAEDARTGPTVTQLREEAKRLGMVVVAPIYELTRDGKRFNTATVIDADGRVLGIYRKTHIPHGSNERASFVERFYYDRGDGDLGAPGHFPVFETAVGRVGVAICYDRHFEGVVRSLARNGAQLVFSPAVTFGEKSRRMWHMEFPVDALRHNVFIGGSNRKGVEPPWTVEYFGESYFVGPNGVVKNVSKHTELVIADLDLAQLAAPDPSGWAIARDRRDDIYS